MIVGFLDLWKRVLESLGIKPWSLEHGKFLTGIPDSETVKKLMSTEFESTEHVRILLFRERYGQERKLLFDSKAVRKRDATSLKGKPEKSCLANRGVKESSIEKSFKLDSVQENDFIYEWQKPCSDEQMLREMIFGSVSISYQGTTTKVHTIRSPPQIMISVVFPAPPVVFFRIGEQELEESGNWNNSTDEITIPKHERAEIQLAHSVPVNVPSRPSGHHEVANDDSDSLQSHDGYNSLPSCHLPPENNTSSLPRSGSYNSLQRRLLRNKATSIELGLQKRVEESQGEEFSRNAGQNRVKLGLSIVISLNEENKDEERQFQDFLFTHITLIESHVMNLKNAVINAYLNRRNFIHLMYEGSSKLQRSIQDLYTAPRLQFPEWLTIISSTNHHNLSYVFVHKLAKLLKQYDKKETNFFVSTLLTAVLTHHLAWVPTVIPTDSKVCSTRNSHKHMPHWVDILAKSRPYNPLWVQLGDLYGALAIPCKLAKTVVTGSKADIIVQFLQVLSYFIRCSDICEQMHEKADTNTKTMNLTKRFDKRDNYETFNDRVSVKYENLTYNVSEASSFNFNVPKSTPRCKFTANKSNILPKTEKKINSMIVRTMTNDSKSTISLVVNQNCLVTVSSAEDMHRTEFVCENTKPHGLTSTNSMQHSLNELCGFNTNNCCVNNLGYESMEKISKLNDNLKLCSITHCESQKATRLNEMSSSKGQQKCSSKCGVDCHHVVGCKHIRCCSNCKGDQIRYQDKEIEQLRMASSRSVVDDSSNHMCTFSSQRCLNFPEHSHEQSLKFISSVCNIKSCQSRNSCMQGNCLALPKVLENICPCVMAEKNNDSYYEHNKKPNIETLISSTDSSPNVQQSEVIEEGYHSMEEPHKPFKEVVHLSEILKMYDNWAPDGLSELCLPESQPCVEKVNPTVYKSFGWSLMAGVSNHFLTDFCLQGIQGSVSDDEIRKDLVNSTQVHVLGEPVAEAVCIVADTDNWSVQLLSSNWCEGDKTGSSGLRVAMSSLVSSICEAILNISELGMPPESCVIHLEDKLQELYFQSQTLSEYLCNNRTPTTLGKVADALNLDASDMPLLLSIATTHSPYLTIFNR